MSDDHPLSPADFERWCELQREAKRQGFRLHRNGPDDAPFYARRAGREWCSFTSLDAIAAWLAD